MMTIVTVGIDLARAVFAIHEAHATGVAKPASARALRNNSLTHCGRRPITPKTLHITQR
jgi:hypothetical protein